jgi:hypothetical protein
MTVLPEFGKVSWVVGLRVFFNPIQWEQGPPEAARPFSSHDQPFAQWHQQAPDTHHTRYQIGCNRPRSGVGSGSRHLHENEWKQTLILAISSSYIATYLWTREGSKSSSGYAQETMLFKPSTPRPPPATEPHKRQRLKTQTTRHRLRSLTTTAQALHPQLRTT